MNESQYMNLLRLLKHRLQEDGKNERKKFEQQYEKREKLQKIAQPGEQSMLIFSVIHMFYGIMLEILPVTLNAVFPFSLPAMLYTNASYRN